MALKLGVIQGGKAVDADVEAKPSETLGTKQWADKLRKRAREIVHTIDFGYTELAKILFELGYTRIDNEPKNSTFWASWGYKSFVEWAEKDLQLHKRKAQHLSHVHHAVEYQLKNISDEVKARMIALPFSKLRLMPRLVKLELEADVIETWVGYAEKTSVPNLEAAISKYVHDYALKGSQQDIAAHIQAGAVAGDLLPSSDADADDDDVDVASTFVDDEDTSPAVLAGNAPPAPQKTTTLQFAAYSGQHEIIEAALKHAGSISGSEVRTQNLALICMDYLNGVAPPQGMDGKLSYVAKMEKLLGIKLVAVHGTGKLLYGMEGLELLAKATADEQS